MGATPKLKARRAAGDTPAERAASGKLARQSAPRSSHAGWAPASARPDPVATLERQAADRVPELVPLRYGRMLASPFAFYRGAAAIMAADLATTPSSGFWVQACGDAHLSNFGGYAAPDRDLVVDINDFDETLPGPWEWDLKRLAASLEIAGRDRSLGQTERRALVLAATRAYRQAMHRLAGLTNLEVWYQRVDAADLREIIEDVSRKALKRFDHVVAKARRKDRLRAFAKLTQRIDGELRFISDPPVLVPLEELFTGDLRQRAEASIKSVIDEYRATLPVDRRHLFDGYRYVHVARKVVGVGSVGTRAWVALFVGRDQNDPLFLQIKEAQPSVLEPFTAPSEFTHQGERVVEGQRLTQATSGILLGWLTAEGPDRQKRDFYVRQLWDEKGSVVIETMSVRGLTTYAEVCASILARAHARSGDRIAIAAYLGKSDRFDRAVAEFAGAYAEQNERDYGALLEAVEDGHVIAERETDG